jgi:hypothetical protein
VTGLRVQGRGRGGRGSVLAIQYRYVTVNSAARAQGIIFYSVAVPGAEQLRLQEPASY